MLDFDSFDAAEAGKLALQARLKKREVQMILDKIREAAEAGDFSLQLDLGSYTDKSDVFTSPFLNNKDYDNYEMFEKFLVSIKDLLHVRGFDVISSLEKDPTKDSICIKVMLNIHWPLDLEGGPYPLQDE